MSKRAALALLTVVASISCARGEPPTAKVDGTVAPLESSGAASPSALAAPPTPAPTASAAPVDASAAPSAPSDIGEQTRDKPSTKTSAFETRMRSLFEAVASDKPEVARASFFPLPAYEKVKAVGNPVADWKRRLLAAYDRDIHDLHVALGNKADRAKYLGVDVPEERVRWVEVGEEYNKLGYYRVFSSKLRYEIDGKERSFLIKSLISWRGEWYVVHLSGMK